jgi:hypothetical protein
VGRGFSRDIKTAGKLGFSPWQCREFEQLVIYEMASLEISDSGFEISDWKF